jgi:hypothetical protein
MLGGEVDVRVRAGEPHREPFLAIATVPVAHHPMGNLVRDIVMKPNTTFRQNFCLAGANLLLQLAPYRLSRGLAGIYAALRHLPQGEAWRHVDAASNEDQVPTVEQHDSNARSVARKLVLWQIITAIIFMDHQGGPPALL